MNLLKVFPGALRLTFTGFLMLIVALTYGQRKGQQSKVEFRKHVLTTDFVSEGAAVGDVNHDKKMDIMAGTFWFEAPTWKRHEILPGKTYDGSKGYSSSFLNFSMDVNQDGWIDQVVIDYPGTPAYWCENPKNKGGHWTKHIIGDSTPVGNESPAFVDVDGDGRKDLLCADTKTKQIVWMQAPARKGDTEWQRFPISDTGAPATDRYSHGIGIGDVNKDGKKDVMVKQGWWEGPSDPKQPNWTFHPAALGDDCSHMHVKDVNGDGKNDIVSASAHKYGIWWYEQSTDAQGKAEFKKHVISEDLSQTHASALIDLNNDGHADLITGKRFYAHNATNSDPGTFEAPLLIWLEFTPGKSPYWARHVIDSDSGVGLNIVTEDINKDKKLDIVISNKKGVFFFENVSGKAARK